MHFLDAGKFASLEDFHDEFKDISHEEQVGKLHQMLAPHLLRRLKKDVMQNIPPKKELILRVELSPLQKEYYKAILTRNYHILARRGQSQISLNNVVMELRKLCGHPYMLGGVEPDVKDVQKAYRKLLEASGKLLLLDKMMAKLKIQDTVILYDSDWNPHADFQAMARAHRLGQMSKIYYDDVAIDRLLDRSLVDNEDRGSDEEEKNGFLKAFKVANFEYVDEEKEAAVIAEEMNNQEMDHQSSHICAADKAKYWDDLLKRNDEQQQTQAITVLGKRKHCHKQVDSLAKAYMVPMFTNDIKCSFPGLKSDRVGRTRRLSNEQRAAIASYFRVYKGRVLASGRLAKKPLFIIKANVL
ncbi:hypothetical protein SUGI_0206490 [Cryptomeria japonica]|nr:hypothetical protein SUGI_0206490 [Cryptomeria japonica]